MGGLAFGDPVTSPSQSGVVYTATWTQVAGSNEQVLTIANSAGSTMPISGFSTVINAPGVSIGSAGSACIRSTPNELRCTGTVQPGSSMTITTTTSQVLAIGTTTMTVDIQVGSVFQGPVTVTLQAGTGTGTPGCKAKLTITKTLEGPGLIDKGFGLYATYRDAPGLRFVVVVRNKTDCPAQGVTLSDPLASSFNCTSASSRIAHDPVDNSTLRSPCAAGEDVSVSLRDPLGTADQGDGQPEEALRLEIDGKFDATGTITNVATVTWTNAGQASSKIHIEVMTKAKFERER